MVRPNLRSLWSVRCAATALTSMAALSAHVSLIACREEVGDLVRFHVALQIFIRTNNGGTKLSYSDLLLSFATANWKTRPAWHPDANFPPSVSTRLFLSLIDYLFPFRNRSQKCLI